MTGVGSTTSISGSNGQFNTTTGLLVTSGNVHLGIGSSDVTVVGSQLTASQGALLATSTIVNATHISSSLNISGSSFYGDGTNLTGVVKTAAGSTSQIQFNNAGSFGATSRATIIAGISTAALIITGSSTTVGSVEAISGSTQVFGIDSSVTGLGAVRGKMIQHIRTGFSVADGGDANSGRYIAIGGNAVNVNATPTNTNCMITPFAGRLISIMYHMPSPVSKQMNSKGPFQLQFKTADVNALKGDTFTNVLSTTGHITASTWPGANVVGGINIQTKVGSLGGTNVTGTFSFGTGSVVGLFFKSGDSSNNNFPGNSSFTTVWEFDQLTPYVSGSGN